MDTSAEVTALTTDAGADIVVPAVSDSAAEWRSSAVGRSADIRLLENGEMPGNVSDNSVMDGNVDTNFCTKAGSSMCEKSAKSVQDGIIRDSHVLDRDDNTNVHQACGTNVTADGAKGDSDAENADSRSQTPLQDELEPDADDLNRNRAITDSSMHDFTEKTADCTEMPASALTALQQCREENGEVSDDEDDDDVGESEVRNQVNANSVSQQAPGDANQLEEEKPTKELEIQKVFCLNISCITTVLLRLLSIKCIVSSFNIAHLRISN